MIERATLLDPGTGIWSTFDGPVETVTATEHGDVVGALRRVEERVERDGRTAVGYVAYEAAPAFDAAYRVVPAARGLPLLCFGLFEPVAIRQGALRQGQRGYTIGALAASQGRATYRQSIRRIHEWIAVGDTYQVNHTFRLRASFSGDPLALFHDVVRSQPLCHAAYLDLGHVVICSASPELMFAINGTRLVSRPMKGTADRGCDLQSDCEAIEALRSSVKNRAENAMIVDMVRNDLGRVAVPGSVRVTRRFEVERHPTVLQMTSTVEAESSAGTAEIFAALFPFASVTGAPKIRTMKLISELETVPRGVYTGAVGVIRPGRHARFAVGIRTAVIEMTRGEIEYGVGSGIVWDSRADDEYDECLAKARILTNTIPDFDILETMLWDPSAGFVLLGRHLERLAQAAEYFGRPIDRDRIQDELSKISGAGPKRVRLLLEADGALRLDEDEVGGDPVAPPVRLGMAATPVDPNDPFLRFKTTRREVYEAARAGRPDCDDVLLWNSRGELTESTVANLVVRLNGELLTPPVACGLLAGTFRAELLERGDVAERVIRVEELADAEELFLVNSVQGWREVEWVGD